MDTKKIRANKNREECQTKSVNIHTDGSKVVSKENLLQFNNRAT